MRSVKPLLEDMRHIDPKSDLINHPQMPALRGGNRVIRAMMKARS